jgi:hypothetical protein
LNRRIFKFRSAMAGRKRKSSKATVPTVDTSAAGKAAVAAAIKHANAHPLHSAASSSSSSSSSSLVEAVLNPLNMMHDPGQGQPGGSSAKKARRGSNISVPSMPLLSAVPWNVNQRIPVFARPEISPAVKLVRNLRSPAIDRRWLVRLGWCRLM